MCYSFRNKSSTPSLKTGRCVLYCTECVGSVWLRKQVAGGWQSSTSTKKSRSVCLIFSKMRSVDCFLLVNTRLNPPKPWVQRGLVFVFQLLKGWSGFVRKQNWLGPREERKTPTFLVPEYGIKTGRKWKAEVQFIFDVADAMSHFLMLWEIFSPDISEKKHFLEKYFTMKLV